MGYGKHVTTLDVSEFWNGLQGSDYNNKGITSLAKFFNRAKGDSDTLDMFLGFNISYIPKAQNRIVNSFIKNACFFT